MNLSDKQTSLILNSLSSGIFGVDRDGLCTFINQEALNLLGYCENEILHNNHYILFHQTQPSGSMYKESESYILKTLKDNQTRHCEEHMIRKDGSVLLVSLSVSSLSDGNAVVAFQDLAKQKEYELYLKKQFLQGNEQLQHLESLLQEQAKLVTLAQMMGNVAHQWRQPLSAITSSISGLKFKKEYGILEDNDIEEVNNAIIYNAQFLSQTIDSFRNFFKKDQPKKIFYVNDSIKNIISIIQASYDNCLIDLKIDLDLDIDYFGNDNLLSQVILNILSNAKDALLQNSTDNKLVRIVLQKFNENIQITIQDNAGGIPDNIINQIFDQYFTTKNPNEGTGLGLYMSNQIIDNHFNGSITVCNIEDINGKGASFCIQFPSNTSSHNELL